VVTGTRTLPGEEGVWEGFEIVPSPPLAPSSPLVVNVTTFDLMRIGF
jgi:hypothetical protein